MPSRFVVSGRPNIRLAFCKAWPLAPFTRLSMTDTMMSSFFNRPSCSDRKQKLVPRTWWLEALPVCSTVTNGSLAYCFVSVARAWSSEPAKRGLAARHSAPQRASQSLSGVPACAWLQPPIQPLSVALWAAKLATREATIQPPAKPLDLASLVQRNISCRSTS